MIRQSLEEYIALSSQIRLYSAPQIDAIKNGNEYQSTLIQNFTRIGVLSTDINRILDEEVYPLLAADHALSEEEAETLMAFSRGLVDMYSLTSLDPMIGYLIAFKLKEEAERKEDDCALIHALDSLVEAAYAMMELSLRLTPYNNVGYTYREEGLKAARCLLTYLEKPLFAALPDNGCKEIVLTNSRYISALLFWNGAQNDEEDREDLELLERALELGEDPFYREEAPEYNWDYHAFRTLQYLVSYSERLNMRGLKSDLLERLYEHLEKLIALWESDPEKYGEYCPYHTLELYRARLLYLTGRTTGEIYKRDLRHLIDQGNLFRFGIHDNIANLFSLDEYLLVVKQAGMDVDDQYALKAYYQNLSLYIHRMPKLGSISFVASILSHILNDYADLPIGGFEESCMQMIAAMHPLTYVHSLTVSALVRLLTSRLLEDAPERFLGFAGSETLDDVRALEHEILDHAEHAALCHVIGKLFVIEIIMTYGRRLTDQEFDLIRSHPDVGAHILCQHKETEKYSEVAQCHHDFYNELDERLSKPPFRKTERAFIDITCCADGLDAATDTVGRSYKKGKSFEEVRDEFDAGSGTRYAPYVVDLLHRPDVEEDIKRILTEGREENYRQAYRFLSQLLNQRG